MVDQHIHIAGNFASAFAAFCAGNNVSAQVIPQLIEVKIVGSHGIQRANHVGSAIRDRKYKAVLIGYVADLKEPNKFAFP